MTLPDAPGFDEPECDDDLDCRTRSASTDHGMLDRVNAVIAVGREFGVTLSSASESDR